MKTNVLVRSVVAVIGAFAVGAAFSQETEAVAQPVRVGVFDSRAVSVAYAPSKFFKEEMVALRDEHGRAKAAGDEELVAKLSAEGQARQTRLHKQGFSTEPVDDILAYVEAELAGVAEAAGVDLIVSKWRIAFQAPGVELVDVTDQLVSLFDPDERVLATVNELVASDPLPLYATDWEAMARSH